MRPVTLNATKAGMTRLREKGGADPNTLFELTNGYVNASRVPTQRPGTTWTYAWPANTKGLMSFKNVLYAFASHIIDTGRTDYVVLTLRHPSATFTGQVKKIHFASPFLGYPYVVCEFDDDQVFHYWLRVPNKWAADTMYKEGDRVEPAIANGYYYEAHSTENPPAWAPGIERTVGDKVQPTVYNGFKYTVVDTSGSGGGGGGGGGTDPDPGGRLGSWNLTYDDGTVPNADVTLLLNIIGRVSHLSAPIDWPFQSGAAVSFQLPAGKHIAAAMTVPMGADSTSHQLTRPSYDGGAGLIKASISATPGDFSGTALLVVHNIASNDSPFIHWRCGSSTTGTAGLTAGSTYYLNIAAEDETVSTVVKMQYN